MKKYEDGKITLLSICVSEVQLKGRLSISVTLPEIGQDPICTLLKNSFSSQSIYLFFIHYQIVVCGEMGNY